MSAYLKRFVVFDRACLSVGVLECWNVIIVVVSANFSYMSLTDVLTLVVSLLQITINSGILTLFIALSMSPTNGWDVTLKRILPHIF
jgi:hypothetical protein